MKRFNLRYYPECQNCLSAGRQDHVVLSEYKDGVWVGFECEVCNHVVLELYSPLDEEVE